MRVISAPPASCRIVSGELGTVVGTSMIFSRIPAPHTSVSTPIGKVHGVEAVAI